MALAILILVMSVGLVQACVLYVIWSMARVAAYQADMLGAVYRLRRQAHACGGESDPAYQFTLDRLVSLVAVGPQISGALLRFMLAQPDGTASAPTPPHTENAELRAAIEEAEAFASRRTLRLVLLHRPSLLWCIGGMKAGFRQEAQAQIWRTHGAVKDKEPVPC